MSEYDDLIHQKSLGLVMLDYLELYRNQEPQQARLVIPRWAKDELDALPEAARESIMSDLEVIAGQHGLTAPVILDVTG